MIIGKPARYLTASGLWLLGSSAAWGLGFAALRSPVIDHPEQLPAVAVTLAALGAVIGLTLGVSATLAFRRMLKIPGSWFVPTAIGVPLGLVIGFYGNGLFLLRQVHRLGMQMAGEGGGATISPPATITLALAGLVLACIQLPFLAKDLAPNLQARALWILGSVAAYGGGWSGSAILLGAAHPSALQGALTGMISGVTILLLVLVLEAEWRRQATR